MHDPNIRIEEYFYYAKIQRDQERCGLGPKEREELSNAGSEPRIPEHISLDSNCGSQADEEHAPT